MENIIRDWREELDNDQKNAAGHIGSHAVVLAGPGTGKTKTLVHHCLALIMEYNIPPEKILVLTFTRVAAYELKKKIEKVLFPYDIKSPYVSTLHSFALRQLLKNSAKIADVLPMPLRIADDWEERNIIIDNIKDDLAEHLNNILTDISRPTDKVKALFNQLSADWETLKAECIEDQRMCRDGRFIGTWQKHRDIFGYTLRSELVYQLKKAFDLTPDFELETDFEYILIDEYQDLNSCDLAVIDELSRKGSKLFAVGDDDQSIYGFRHANPDGIRNFKNKYDATRHDLGVCYRCSKKILDLAEFIADQDTKRLPKKTRPKLGAKNGEIHLLCCVDQNQEAELIAKTCKVILDIESNTTILILMRSDYKQRISNVLIEAFNRHNIPIAINLDETPFDTDEGRKVLSLIRLIVNPKDSLSWYALLRLESGIGKETVKAIRQFAEERHFAEERPFDFYNALEAINDNPSLLSRNLRIVKLTDRINEIRNLLSKFENNMESIQKQVDEIILSVTLDEQKQSDLRNYLGQIILETQANSLSDLLQSISLSMQKTEQKLETGKANIMTMHKAKGLDSDIVFIVGAEKQFLPGRNTGEAIDDERRLFYVSLTRAKNSLYITYCGRRTGSQGYSENGEYNPRRDITPFLRNSPLKREDISL
jgi:DNA helicase II / ATP-dependent DNA helicase PcrA